MRVASVVDASLQVGVGRVAEYRDFFQWGGLLDVSARIVAGSLSERRNP